MTDAVNNTLQRLVPIFQDVLDDDSLAIDATTTAQDVDGWDSLAHIRLGVSIEKAFSLRFSAAEISELQNVGDMVALIVKKQTGA